MTFGWNGFSFDHSADYAPAEITGDRQSGFFRLQSWPGEAIQGRWSPGKKNPEPEDLDRYFNDLKRSSTKRKLVFHQRVRPTSEGFDYSYESQYKASGFCIFSPASNRTFMVEAVNSHSSGALKALQAVRLTWQDDDLYDRWAMMGLDVLLPRGLKAKAPKLLSGRTTITLEGQGVTIQLERWGLAQQILARHDLAEWAKATLRLKSASITERDTGIELSSSSLLLPPIRALVLVDSKGNQLHTIRVQGRSSHWEPKWDWFQI